VRKKLFTDLRKKMLILRKKILIFEKRTDFFSGFFAVQWRVSRFSNDFAATNSPINIAINKTNIEINKKY